MVRSGKLDVRYRDDTTVVSTLLDRPRDADWLYVLAHGAGAGMTHEFMDDMSRRFAVRGIATLRYQFPYMQAGRRAPDRAPRCIATVRAAMSRAARMDLRIVAGGKSMGGRMTSMAAAEEDFDAVEAFAFLGFPLHPPKKPGTDRADHLLAIDAPMLFLQGDRDALAGLDLLKGVLKSLPSATLSVIDDGDHAFKVRRRSGRTDDEAREEMADQLRAFLDDI